MFNLHRDAESACCTTSRNKKTSHLERIRAISRFGRQTGRGDTRIWKNKVAAAFSGRASADFRDALSRSRRVKSERFRTTQQQRGLFNFSRLALRRLRASFRPANKRVANSFSLKADESERGKKAAHRNCGQNNATHEFSMKQKLMNLSAVPYLKYAIWKQLTVNFKKRSQAWWSNVKCVLREIICIAIYEILQYCILQL